MPLQSRGKSGYLPFWKVRFLLDDPGGIFKLHERIRSALMSKDTNPVEILSLLKDLSVYFRDLKIVGRLEENPSTSIKSIIK